MPCESSAKCLATFPPDVSAFAMPAIRRFCTDIWIESVQRRQSTGDNFVNKICIVAKIRNFIIGLVSIIYIIYGHVIFKALGQPGNYSIKKSRRYESLTRWQYRLFFFYEELCLRFQSVEVRFIRRGPARPVYLHPTEGNKWFLISRLQGRQ